MFERFTTTARHAVIDAQTLASHNGAHRIDSRHLLLALLQTVEVRDALTAIGANAGQLTAEAGEDVAKAGLDAEALAAIGIDLAEVNRQAENVFGPEALAGSTRSKRHVPFARDAKKALELALREAIWLHQRTISERHLLLGILRADCPGRQLLALHVDIATLRSALASPTEATA